jgi:amino acid transporter
MVAATPTDMGSSAKTAFTRTASGLVRNMSLWDAALFGLLSTGGAYTFILLSPLPQFLTPGVSIPVLIGVTLVFSVIVYFVYAALGSAMPRAGGDYVYETRTINRIIGFSIPWASNLLFWLVFPTTGAFVANTLGLIPICRAFGWDSAADWLSTAAGATVVVLVILALQWSLAVFGLRFFRVAQRYVLIPFVVIGMATMIIVFAVKWNADFSKAFDAYNAGTGITYDSVRAAAAENGYVPTGFDLRNTMVWFVVLAGIVPFTMFAAQGMLGEVKDAANLRRLFQAFLLPGLFMAIGVLLIPWVMMQHVVGNDFLNQFATAYGSGAVAPPYSPNINIFVEMLAPSKWVVLLVSLGFIGGGFGISSVAFLNAARVMMAMSLDQLLPAFVSKVSQRFYTPMVALTIWALVAVPISVWFNYGDPTVAFAFLTGVMVSATTVVAFTVLGGTLFPYTAPGIYASAPVRSVTIFGVPLITVLGTLALIMIVPAIVWALVAPELGVTGSTARICLISVYASGFVVYTLWALIERSRGVDTSLAVKEVPPE